MTTSPAMAEMANWKDCEVAVKWVYSADNIITMPYRDNLQSSVFSYYSLDYQLQESELISGDEYNICAREAIKGFL